MSSTRSGEPSADIFVPVVTPVKDATSSIASRQGEFCTCTSVTGTVYDSENKFLKRDKWVKYLDGKAEETKTRYNKRKLDEMTKTTYQKAVSGTLIKNREDLTNRITEIITSPNKKWKEAKKEYQLPRDYFS